MCGIDRHVDPVLARPLAKNPKARFGSADEFGRAMQQGRRVVPGRAEPLGDGARVRAEPAGVVTQASDANAAMRANAEQMDKVMAAIRDAGIAERDVQTTGVNVHPQYRYAENQAPTITGYQASNTVSLKVRDMARLGKVLDALVASGANQVNGPSFEIDEPEAVYDEARKAALAKAQSRATMYAETLGLRVRRIVSISEGGGFEPPRPMPMMAMARGKAETDTAVSPGETTLTANLDVVFELGK